MKQFAEWFLDRDFPSSLVLAGIGSLCLFGFVGESEILMLSVIFLAIYLLIRIIFLALLIWEHGLGLQITVTLGAGFLLTGFTWILILVLLIS